ncbi:hypothetical protein bthur0001_54640 [Bacillus thuringiensis serovar tochigiensis BGSC 4Y1]|nr:hypothetical protein bthur0001_54640 [Bacillus thuringiensis serovar tochigiensis BGSC 4Y1]
MNDIIPNTTLAIDTIQIINGSAIGFIGPDTVTLEPGTYLVHYTHTGNPLGPEEVTTKVLAIQLLLDGNPIQGSYIWAADPDTQIPDQNTHLHIDNEIIITVLTSGSLQIENRSSGGGSGVLPNVVTFLSGNNPIRTSINISKID